MAKKRWIGQARERMKEKGTVGAFTKQAKRAGKTPQRFAAQVLSSPGRYSKRTVKRARFARTMGEIGAKKSGKQLPPVLRVAKPAKPRVRRRRRKKAA